MKMKAKRSKKSFKIAQHKWIIFTYWNFYNLFT